MKNLLLYFLPFLTLSKNVFSAKEPAYILTLEAIEKCKGSNLNEFVSFDHLKIFRNHTADGYIEVIEDLPIDATVKFQAFSLRNNSWIASPLSFENLDLCRFLEKDVWFVPVGRLIMNIPDRCPVRKGHLRFKSLVIHKRTKGIIPAGCFKARMTIMDKDKPLCCIDTVTKITEYSKRHEHNPCIDP